MREKLSLIYSKLYFFIFLFDWEKVLMKRERVDERTRESYLKFLIRKCQGKRKWKRKGRMHEPSNWWVESHIAHPPYFSGVQFTCKRVNYRVGRGDPTFGNQVKADQSGWRIWKWKQKVLFWHECRIPGESRGKRMSSVGKKKMFTFIWCSIRFLFNFHFLRNRLLQN